MIFVRNWIGGPFAGHVFMVPRHARVVLVPNGDQMVGRYVLSNLGWSWHE
jgi:hypothetical protein